MRLKKRRKNYVRINKSKIDSMRFDHEDVLTCKEQIEKRAKYLRKAMSVRKSYREIFNIRFKNIENSLLETRAAIRNVTKNYVVLNNNTHIPIKSIFSIYV